MGILVGVVLVAGIAVAAVLLLRDSGGDEESVIDPVEAPALSGIEPLGVPLSSEPDTPRVHPVTMTDGQEATVFVSADQAFSPQIAVVDPDGDPLIADVTDLDGQGVSASFTAAGSGEHTVFVTGFSAAQSAYTIEVHFDAGFTTPKEVAVGDCVDRWNDQPWESVSGFLVVSCGEPHEGQVFAQTAGFDGDEEAAQNQCRQARINRVEVPGSVNWNAYWGDDLTCVLVGQDGALLESSLVPD